jgi:hypothetical protein
VINYWFFTTVERRYNIGAMRWVPDVLTWNGEDFRIAERLRKPEWER